jgi:hypothetical protein
MARSGSTDFSVTAQGANRIVRGLGGKPGEGMNAQDDEANALQALELMIKSWQAEHIGLWKNTEIAVFFSDEGYSYSLGPTGDHAASTYVVTEVATAASSGAGSIDVDSITGMTNGDAIGIQLDDGTLQWTTINGVPAGSTVTLTAVLTDDVAVDNKVYTYTDLISRPLAISEGRIVRDSGTESPLEILTRERYMLLASKTTTGKASQVYYDPQLDNGVLKVWPAADSVADYLKLTARLPIHFDFPVEWFLGLKWNLAHEISGEFEMELQNRIYLEQKAGRLKDKLEAFDYEHGSVYFEVEDD